MKNLIFLLIPLLFLSSCSIDWNDEKEKKIADLEKQLTELKAKDDDALFKKKIECQEKYEETYGPGTREKYSELSIEVFYSETRNSCLTRVTGWNDNERSFIIGDVLGRNRLFSFSVDKEWNVTDRNNLEGDLEKLKCDFDYNLKLLGGEPYFDEKCNSF